ncbi:hypothetical protein QQF64_010203 [Cirrhinus molitorella]|uniref:Vomeronasal type-1 receptor n=1 Tax=Cirrhinus molitorella TaxID=172907 RepID=A0ABR3M3C2_9TELE
MHRYSALRKDESVLALALWGLNPAAYCVITAFQSLVSVFVMIPGNQRSRFSDVGKTRVTLIYFVKILFALLLRHKSV